MIKIVSGLILTFLFLACGNRQDYVPPEDPLFIKMTAEECGISFRNDVKDDSFFNAINYRNFYNGGGVAIGDINNDGLADVMMTANQGTNKLFLNKGDFQFEDITQKAGITKKHAWSTGITMVDINADGLLDIYICAAGIAKGDERKNELFINQGDLQFREEAARYHLQDSGGLHTHASFFDYDADGDLDVFLLNNSGLVPVTNFGRGSNRMIRNNILGNKLLQNDNGIFKDVSEEAGIYGSNIGFGLGIAIGDINGDKWPDMYVSNDFFEKDYLYINNRNGTFKEISDSAIAQMSQSSMGADMADINNDGLVDIFSTDMLPEDDYRLKKNTRFDNYDFYNGKFKAGFHHQFVSNMLHLNNGNNSFTEISQYSGVNATDWSWGALIFDCDNDGWKDIAVCNGMFLDLTDQDYIDFTASENAKKMFGNNRSTEDLEQVKSMLVSKPLPNYLFINQHDLTFKNQSHELGLGEPGYSNGAAYGDLDNDGDPDLVVNNINSGSFVYRNTTSEKYKRSFLRVKLQGAGKNLYGIGAEVTVYSENSRQTLQNFPSRGFQSSVDPVLTFGLGHSKVIDSIVIIWPGLRKQTLKNISAGKEIILKEKEAVDEFIPGKPKGKSIFKDVSSFSLTGNIVHQENDYVDFDRERLMPHMLSTEGPKITIGDVNGDGLEDFFVPGAKHDTAKIFIQDKAGRFTQWLPQPDFAADKAYEGIGSAFSDIDKDGDLDLIVASGGNLEQEGSEFLQPRLYLNDGEGHFARSGDRIPNIHVNASCVAVNDFDNDGFPDLFIGGRSVPGIYGKTPGSFLLKNVNGKFIDVTTALATDLKHAGMITAAIWEDIDNDEIKELILAGEWMPLTIFKNIGGKLQKTEMPLTNGWWNCIRAADLDNDGDMDLVAGNLGLNTKIRADSMRPAQLFINDFDANGTVECVMTYYNKDGKNYPYYMRGDLVSQIPSLKKTLLRYKDYAGKTMQQIFTEKQLENAVVKSAYEFRSGLLINNGKGKFTFQALPDVAQMSPVFAIAIDDLNGDQVKDIFLAGNFYGLVPDFGRYDANRGTVLLGKGNNRFEYFPADSSGLYYESEARDAAIIKTADKVQTIILARNNKSLRLFKRR